MWVPVFGCAVVGSLTGAVGVVVVPQGVASGSVWAPDSSAIHRSAILLRLSMCRTCMSPRRYVLDRICSDQEQYLGGWKSTAPNSAPQFVS